MTNSELSHLVGLFRPTLVRDLVAQGFPSSVAGAILNWFDPRKDDYLEHVSLWREFLCRGACCHGDIPKQLLEIGVVKETVYHTLVLDPEMDGTTRLIHACALLFYKSHAPARQEMDIDSVSLRLSSPPDVSLTRSDIRRLRHALRHVDVMPDYEALGCYGPGSTAESYTNFERWNRKGLIPPVPPSWYRWSLLDDWVPDGVANDFRITKIACVPKTLKSDRVVSSEPAQSMYAQLTLSRYLDRAMHTIFNGSVYLHDQSLHNTLLRCPEYRTIDLSDASDYVSCDLVSRILPNLWTILSKVRSTHSVFPDGRLIELSTFAPMGSGVCFTVLTLVNLAICSVVCKHPFHVYGDDVIVHKDDIIEVTEWQQAAGLKVNTGKTCYHGRFRESCGLEILGDTEITPVYVRDTLESSAWSKLNELCEKFTRLGWFNTCDLIGAFVKHQSRPVRVNRYLQRYEVLCPCIISTDRTTYVGGYAGIRKWFLQKHEASKERESIAFVTKGRTKLVSRYRALDDFPFLRDYIDCSLNSRSVAPLARLARRKRRS